MYFNLIGTVLILITCCLCGFVAYAFYFGCDPLLAGKISRHDQVKNYFLLNKCNANIPERFKSIYFDVHRYCHILSWICSKATTAYPVFSLRVFIVQL